MCHKLIHLPFYNTSEYFDNSKYFSTLISTVIMLLACYENIQLYWEVKKI